MSCKCIYEAHCDPKRPGCRLAAGGTVNMGGGVCGPRDEAKMVPASRLAGAVSDEAVERLRASLWATWGANRQTTDWPTTAQLRRALLAAVGGK
jgi:hypothetical protein